MSNGMRLDPATARVLLGEKAKAAQQQYLLKIVADIYAPLAVGVLSSAEEMDEALTALDEAADGAILAAQRLMQRLNHESRTS